MAEQTTEKKGNYYVKTIYPLVVLAVFFGLILGMAYKFMGPIIEETMKNEEKRALQSVIQGADSFEVLTNNGSIYYKGLDTQKQVVGYIFKEGAIGYGGPIVTLVGITNGVVENIFILSADQETPGLGYKCMSKSWQKKFSGLVAEKVPTSLTEFEAAGLSAITGATLTSVAVTANIKKAFKLYESITQGQGGQDVN